MSMCLILCACVCVCVLCGVCVCVCVCVQCFKVKEQIFKFTGLLARSMYICLKTPRYPRVTAKLKDFWRYCKFFYTAYFVQSGDITSERLRHAYSRARTSDSA